MTAPFLFLFLLQGTLIAVDEIFCHYRRTIPAWERWGHPLDTLVMIIPLTLLSQVPMLSLKTYSFFSVFSCLFITKDEWVHSRHCGGFENWLHSILFMIHPLILVTAWWAHRESPHLISWLLSLPFLFFIYQLFYWNIYADRSISERPTTH